jgi:hypothetical protein
VHLTVTGHASAGLELRPHPEGIPQHLPKNLQHRIIAPSKVQMTDAPACEDQCRPEFIMGTRQTANLWHSSL